MIKGVSFASVDLTHSCLLHNRNWGQHNFTTNVCWGHNTSVCKLLKILTSLGGLHCNLRIDSRSSLAYKLAAITYVTQTQIWMLGDGMRLKCRTSSNSHFKDTNAQHYVHISFLFSVKFG